MVQNDFNFSDNVLQEQYQFIQYFLFLNWYRYGTFEWVV